MWMKEEELNARHLIAHTDSGIEIKRRKKISIEISSKISKLTEEYLGHRRSRASFLKGCAYTLADMHPPSKLIKDVSDNTESVFPEISSDILSVQISSILSECGSCSANVTEQARVSFSLPDQAWQFATCLTLGLPLISYVFPLLMLPRVISSHQSSIRSADIESDGNCFFRAISYLISGSQDSHHIIREKICEILDKYFALLNVERTYSSDHHMRDNGVWASENEILACASLLNVPIYLFSSFASTALKSWSKFAPHTSIPSVLPPLFNSALYLDHQNGNHFVPVFDV